MVSINLFFFIFGVISYYIYKKLIKRRKKYINILPIIENKYFEKSSELILKEQLNRNYLFFGEQGMTLIRNSCILIINCETIGSHVAVMLARSGIKKLIIIDNNKLTLEKYKYHPFACLDDLNKDNLFLIKDYIKKINPNTELILIKEKINFEKNNLGKIDYILDCTNNENIIEKCKIINFSKNNKIKLISIYNLSLYQDNPTLIRHSKFSLLQENFNENFDDNNNIYRIYVTNYKKLYPKESSIPDFIIIYSSQKNSKKPENSNFKENLFCYGVMADSACALILCDLAHFQFEKDVENILKNKNEQKISGKSLSEAILEYKRNEIDKNKCDINMMDKLCYNDFRNICTEFKNGSCLQMKQVAKMKFIRWRRYKEPSKDNIVMMGRDEISKHLTIKNENDLINFYGMDTVNRIDSILKKIGNK